MEGTGNVPEDRQLMNIEEVSLEEAQLTEQLYNSAGLDPVVEAGLKDYDKRLQKEDKLISKVFGPRGSDIKGYGEAVAKRVALAVYGLMNRQYGGKVGDLRSYIGELEDERDRANRRYDDLMGRVVGILGDEYRDLRSDSREFMEKLTTTLGEDLKDSKIDQAALAEKLADIDGLRSRIKDLDEELVKQKEDYEAQLQAQAAAHAETAAGLEARIKETEEAGVKAQADHEARLETLNNEHAAEKEQLEARIAGLETQISELTGELEQLRADHDRLQAAAAGLAAAIPYADIGDSLKEELYQFLLKDSKVPHMVIDGVGKFIDFRKYLGLAAEKGAGEAVRQAGEKLREAGAEAPEKPE